jgi:hypothetical protein
MRYFFISFAHDGGYGSLSLQLEEFPSHQAIIKTIQEEDKTASNITVLSLFEFETKEDFEAFNS